VILGELDGKDFN